MNVPVASGLVNGNTQSFRSRQCTSYQIEDRRSVAILAPVLKYDELKPLGLSRQADHTKRST